MEKVEEQEIDWHQSVYIWTDILEHKIMEQVNQKILLCEYRQIIPIYAISKIWSKNKIFEY